MSKSSAVIVFTIVAISLGVASCVNSIKPDRPFESDDVRDLKLLCKKIDVSQEGADPDRALELESAEGGIAEVYNLEDGFTVIRGTMLGESYRFNFAYRYEKGALLCATESGTSIGTIMQDAPPDERPPLYWSYDFRGYDKADLLFSLSDSAPSDTEPFHTPAETLSYADELYKRSLVVED